MDRAHLQTSCHIPNHRLAVSNKHPSSFPKNASTSEPNHVSMQPPRQRVHGIVAQIQAEYNRVLHVNYRLKALLQQRDKQMADIEELLTHQSGYLKASEERDWAVEQMCNKLEVEMASQNAVRHEAHRRVQ